MSEYLEFAVADLGRFELLQRIFERLKHDKAANQIGDDAQYLEYFDQVARDYFGGYTEEENQAWLKRWQATPYKKRWQAPSLQRRWHFGSMIDLIRNGEYQLQHCHLIEPGLAHLTYLPWAYPYGGTGCLRALIESFGFSIKAVSDE